eukprot:SAG11_NODE_363_length_10162_cov_28.285004_2_plen_81_part_00
MRYRPRCGLPLTVYLAAYRHTWPHLYSHSGHHAPYSRFLRDCDNRRGRPAPASTVPPPSAPLAAAPAAPRTQPLSTPRQF